jgi:capsular exopolysaccharide synthesis family protein
LNGKIGSLDSRTKSLLTENRNELSAVEGNLLGTYRGKSLKTIFVTSCHPREGKTTASVSMAYALTTEANAKVLLIDGNAQSPKIHELFNIQSAPGFSDYLSSGSPFTDFISLTEYENLKIMPFGTESIKKGETFESEMFQDRLNSLKLDFNYILIDGSSVFSSSNISRIAQHVDGILFVVECENTKWEALQQAKENISNVGGNIIGAVMNKRKYYIPKKLYANI